MNTTIRNLAVLLFASAVGASCTMNSQEAPPLTGPSEFATSVTVAVTPDVLRQDGASQSVVIVSARDAGGQPLSNLALRAEILYNGMAADFGTLSARSLATGSDGRASLVYTAPANSSGVDSFVAIAVTPLGNNYENAVARTATIRLVPPGIVLPPSGLSAAFTFSPQTPTEGQNVLFDARTSTSPANNPITAYEWDFGNGRTATGQTVTHAFSGPGTYFVRLTVRDSLGRAASTTQSVPVSQGAAPVADFSFSPTDPLPADIVHFNASLSRAAAGRRLVSYTWDFGDGTTGSGDRVSHGYVAQRTYTVTLTVTDDIGRTATVSKPIAVKVPEDDGEPSH